MRKMLRFLACLCLPVLVHGQATIGLTQPDSGGFGGYTLFAPNGALVTYLIDPCGRVVNQWESAYYPGLSAYLLEDGSLLRACRLAVQSGPIGGGLIERRDWDNNLLWSYVYSGNTYRQHHDIHPMPNGNVLMVARESKTNAECIAKGRNPALLNNNGLQMEYIVEVQPIGSDSGVVVWEWHMWDHLIQDFDSTKANFGVVADHPELLDINNSTTVSVDWLHCNAVDYHPGLDQVIFNSRNQNEFWIVDHGTTTAEAASHAGGSRGRGGDFLYRWGSPANYDRGTVADQQLWVQHNAHWIPAGLPGAGQILIFNNGDGRPAGQYSTVDAIQPPVDSQGDYPIATGMPWGPATPAWTYQAPVPTDFYSHNISGAQRLPNGNTHICDGANGRIFEVDSLGNKVWEYIVPLSSGVPLSQGTVPTNNAAFRSYRYPADYPAFSGRDLTPGDRIELNPLPLPASCLASASAPSQAPEVRISPNPCPTQLTLACPPGTRYAVYDLLGNLLVQGKAVSYETQLATTAWQPGIFLLEVQAASGRQVFRIVHP